MDIVPKLNLNKHPKDCDNLSFVNAHHVKVSNDESCVTNEDSIRENKFIHDYLVSYYTVNVTYKVVGIIPCNNELVIIIKAGTISVDADIFRYQEPLNGNAEKMYCAYGGVNSPNRFSYQGGLIKGAFTYNVEGSLIVAITEYKVANVKIPLRTINLGNSNNPNVSNDKDISNSKLSISPEVKVPAVNGLSYVSGSAYKGWYYMFIRYKINTVDYTRWYSIGAPIYVDTLEQYQIVRYAFNRDTRFAANALGNITSPSWSAEGFGVGCSDYFSNATDIAKETFKVNLQFPPDLDYDKYQIGVTCSSKSYLKAFRTTDIISPKGQDSTFFGINQSYTLDSKSLVEYSASAFIDENFNYFNAENIINYKNRLYISNYLEDNPNNDNINRALIDAIVVNPATSGMSDFGLVYDTAILSNSNTGFNQYDTYDIINIPFMEYANISAETLVIISAPGFATKRVKANQVYITTGGVTPGFAYVEVREEGALGSIIKTNYGKQPFNGYVTITVPDIDNGEAATYKLKTDNLAINGGMQYTNTNIDFENRKKFSSLIPGELYNLFIHFTNKYNDATNGYRLENKTKWVTEDNPNIEIIPIPFTMKIGSTLVTYYASAKIDANVSFSNYELNGRYDILTQDVEFYADYNTYSDNPALTSKLNTIDSDAARTSFKEYFSSFANIDNIATKWYQITYGPGTDKFHLFINNNGDRLFKVPMIESFNQAWSGFPDEITPFKQYNTHALMRLNISNVEIPEGYDGYYISYEQFESQRRVTGMLSRNDFRSQDYINVSGNVVDRNNYNNKKSDRMYFYSGLYDISDTIQLDYSMMRFEGVNIFKKNDIPEWDYFQRNNSFAFVHDMNKPQVDAYSRGVNRTYAMPECKIVVADSAVDNRMGLGTALQIKDSYNLFDNSDPSDSDKNKIKLYRVTLINNTRSIYMSNSKKLIRLTDVNYRTKDAPINQKYGVYVSTGYNGHYSYDGIMVYEQSGMKFNVTDVKVKYILSEDEFYKFDVPVATPHTYQNDIPFLAYVQMPICSDIFFESKCFKKPPTGTIASVKSDPNKFAKGAMVIPVNSIDLFENRQGSSDQFNTKTYDNYRNDLVSVDKYDKTLRRSNVIQDETRINGWRTFPIEGYKNITENKGRITNLIGIGTVLLVHTEHSLFMFNTDSTLRTEDKDVQLLQPDAFEVQYNEVFTSDKGFGGLQDDKSFVVDQFGYIFYSEDTHRLYQFDDKQLGNIDEDILEWLSKYKPFNVRMANDKDNYRILIKFEYIVAGINKSIIFSYNYKTKYFVSQHLYHFDEAYNTKTRLYLKCDNTHNGCSLHSFRYNTTGYSSFDNIKGALGTVAVRASRISIIVNEKFASVKFLEYISYKLTKYKDSTGIDFTNLPVEEYKTPFAGNTLSVYNNSINTGILDINVNEENAKNVFGTFDKPYWELEVWNFSYLRNNISARPTGSIDDNMTRLYGNYFIFEYVFNNTDGLRVDFESLKYVLSGN